MANAPYSSVVSPLNPNVLSADINTFITGSTTSPTPAAGSYARYIQIGNIVQIQFKYIFATVPGGGSILRISVPVPINTTYPKPQGVFHIRYFNSPGTGQVHYGFYNERDANTINLVAQPTFGGVPEAFTSIFPNTLIAGDIINGYIIYETTG